MQAGSLSAQARRARIRERLSRDGSVDLSSAAGELAVSEMTIRRDLVELERQGAARRVRGGAVAVGPELFDQRAAKNNSAKIRIAAKLRTVLPKKGQVAMDASSTIHRFAAELVAQELIVLTMGLETFQTLKGRVGHLLLAGGELDEATGSFVGPLAMRTLNDLHFDVAFLSMAGLDPVRGAMETTLAEAEIMRGFRRASATLVVAADSSKLGQVASAAALRFSEIDLLVTELEPTDTALDPYRDLVELL